MATLLHRPCWRLAWAPVLWTTALLPSTIWAAAPEPAVEVAAAATPSTVATSVPAARPWSALHVDLHGYFRARYVRMANVPVARLDNDGTLASATHTGRDDASDAHFVHSRLRLEPSLRWGGDPGAGVLPKAALHAQVDLLDNVVWGDNVREAGVPLFAENPGQTGLAGDERPSLLVRRLWLEVATPVGQLRLGRQASHGGLGLLFNDGNGFRNDFGDATGGSSFDRVAFATRPLTIYRALKHGDRRETPLILLLGHDWLVEDGLGFGSTPAAASSRLNGGPFGFLSTPTCGDARAPDGTTPTRKCDDDVSQWLTALVWRDLSPRWYRDTDELQLGAVYVSRGQDFNQSRMHILDGFWRLQVGLGHTGPSLLTEGEVAAIRGSTRGIKLLPGGYFNNKTGLADNVLEGDVLNFAGRAGLTTPGWDALLEFGRSSGDEQLIGDSRFKMFPVHADYKMGLLMYPVALWARSVNTAAGRVSDALNSGGGIFNSRYVNAKARRRWIYDGHQLEVVAQGLLGWADTLNGGEVLGATADYFAPRDPANPWANNRCQAFEPACALGWEVDVAAQLKWVPLPELPGASANDRYLLRWSLELGVLSAGQALAPRLAVGADTLWTAQSRLAMVW